MGAAGKYKKQYYACVRACERQDPRTYLGASNWLCGLFCDRIITDALEKGEEPPDFTTEFERCDKQYPGEGPQNWACVGHENVNMSCHQKCAWTDSPTCMQDCAEITSPNNFIGAWIFR